MSDENSKHDELYEKLNGQDTEALVAQKLKSVAELKKNVAAATSNTVDFNKAAEALKELDKVLKQLASTDVSKSSERAKLTKTLEKIQATIGSLQIIDQLNSEKVKITKSLEKVAESAAVIPVIEKVLKGRDF